MFSYLLSWLFLLFPELVVPEGFIHEMWQKHGSGLHGLCHQPLTGPPYWQFWAPAATTGQNHHFTGMWNFTHLILYCTNADTTVFRFIQINSSKSFATLSTPVCWAWEAGQTLNLVFVRCTWKSYLICLSNVHYVCLFCFFLNHC